MSAATTVILIGCGGTGGWLAPALARIAFVRQQNENPMHLVFVDGDKVEEKNIGRQNFAMAEIGRNKAECLASRYAAAWGLENSYIPEPLQDTTEVRAMGRSQKILLLVGCVDTAAARKTIRNHLLNGFGYNTNSLWLDCGNGRSSGQVLLGNMGKWPKDFTLQAFPKKGVCIHLPAPSLQEPSLLIPRPDEGKEEALSCAELTMRSAQGLTINQRTAAEAANMLNRLLLTGNLRHFATYFDEDTGSNLVRYATPETVEDVIRQGATV